MSLDDLLAVVREFLNPDVSRSGLDRCLRRHGVGNLRDLKAKDARPKHSGFKAYEPGYIHIDVKYLPQMEDQPSRRYRDRADPGTNVQTKRKPSNRISSCSATNKMRIQRQSG